MSSGRGAFLGALLLACALVGALTYARPAPRHVAESAEHTNRLARESSPYLLQHAHNPVDWYPWGPEAFEKAQREDKPIFLSVGYSTCHWCHVMERESFEDPQVAELLNRYFISIKVDREERPDVDEVYMTAVLLLTGNGGWPQTTVLTPEGLPFFAGTYIPKQSRFGRPGMLELLPRLGRLWEGERPRVEAAARELSVAVRGHLESHGRERVPLDPEMLTRTREELLRRYSPEQDGFGPAPLFPPHQALAWLLESGGPRERQAALRLLRGMALGGVRDQLAGGFHRYSTDADWHLPHFEKMLYDNAMLLRTYALAWQASDDQEMRRTAEEIFEWLEGSMSDPAGGFYSGVDADSDGVEGKYYLWTAEELRNILGREQARRVMAAYGVTEEGNFREEATGHATGESVLDPPRPFEETAALAGLSPADFRHALDQARALLLQERSKRIPPATDDKVLASWNGLAIGSLAVAGKILGREDMVQRSRTAAIFILDRLHTDSGLLHVYRQERAYQAAFLDDYAYLVDGLIDLHEATGEGRWLEAAIRLADEMHRLYQDPKGGAYFVTSPDHDELLLARFKSPYDSAVPSANGVAARALLRLSRQGAPPRFEQRGRAILKDLSGEMAGNPGATLGLMRALTLAELPLAPASQRATDEGPRLQARGRHVRLQARAPRSLDPGGSGTVILTLEIEEGWHINSHQPFQKSLVPTAVEARSSKNRVSVDGPDYPAGRKRHFSLSGEPLSVYEGVLRLELRIRAGQEAGEDALELTVAVQACNDSTCLAPEQLQLRVPVQVEERVKGEPQAPSRPR